MHEMLRNHSSFLWGLCFIAIVTGSAASAASAQDGKARGASAALASAKPLNIIPDTTPNTTATTRPARGSARRSAKNKAARTSEPPADRYFIEFRSRTAVSYGHTFVVHGLVNGSNNILPSQVAGLHPAGNSSAVYILGHVLPVPAETGASYGDTDEQYLTARYRIEMGQARYLRVAAFIKQWQAKNTIWTATKYNCNWFAGEIAQFMGLRTPNPLEYPEDYINQLRSLNSRS